MPSRTLTIRWGTTLGAQNRLECDDEKTVLELIDHIWEKASPPLPRQDERGNDIEYGLYTRQVGAEYVRLLERRELGEALSQMADTLYLADHKHPWWLTATEPIRLLSCQVQLCPGCVVNLALGGLSISRSYLMDQLPTAVTKSERQKHEHGRHSPLAKVSRDEHCVIYVQDGAWLIRARRMTYIDGQSVALNVPIILLVGRPLEVILGDKGWHIEIRVFQS